MAGRGKVKKFVRSCDFYSGLKKKVKIFLNQSPSYLIIKNDGKHFCLPSLQRISTMIITPFIIKFLICLCCFCSYPQYSAGSSGILFSISSKWRCAPCALSQKISSPTVPITSPDFTSFPGSRPSAVLCRPQ